MSGDKFTQSYGDVDLMFDPGPHEYSAQLENGLVYPLANVSEICDYLPKFLARWGEDNGIKGMQEVVRRAIRNGPSGAPGGEVVPVDLSAFSLDDHKFNLSLIRGMGLDSESIKNAAADRGTTVHAAFRGWVVNGIKPDPSHYTGEVAGYIRSLRMLTDDLGSGLETVLCEQPICSLQYGFAGTPDYFGTLTKPVKLQVGGNVGVGKRPKYAEFAPGTSPLIDLKTSKQVFQSHTYQLSGYELMIRELNLGEPTARWVVLIKPDGAGYNVKTQPDRMQGFLHLVGVYNSDKRPEGFLGRTTFVGLAAVA